MVEGKNWYVGKSNSLKLTKEFYSFSIHDNKWLALKIQRSISARIRKIAWHTHARFYIFTTLDFTHFGMYRYF